MGGFKPGDLVMLKSGGPTMTAETWSSTYDQWECKWFDAKGELHTKLFSPEALKKADT